MSLEERRKVYIPAGVRVQVPVKECGEKLVSIKEAFVIDKQQIILASVWSIEDVPELCLRESVVQKLLAVSRGLGSGYQLKITDAFRPIHLQQRLFEDVQAQIKKEYSELSQEELIIRAERFVANPNSCPPHSTGGAVDLTIVDTFGKELDMGTPIDTLDERVETFYPDLSKDIMANRLRLLDGMENEGFVNLASEWWHYSYGDRYWAAFTGATGAIYDSKIEYNS